MVIYAIICAKNNENIGYNTPFAKAAMIAIINAGSYYVL